MKRYIAFAGLTCYPNGGWDDFVLDADTEAEAKAAFVIIKDNNSYDWWHIVDTETKKIVYWQSGTHCCSINPETLLNVSKTQAVHTQVE